MYYPMRTLYHYLCSIGQIRHGLMIVLLCIPLSACQSQVTKNTMNSTLKDVSSFTEFEQKIAQRMSLDIRYFCADINGSPSVKSSLHCRKAVTELPQELASLVSKSSVGGIVLFAENVESTEQVVKLTHDIQQAAIQSEHGKPLIISIDQEGGRVARFTKMTGFAGNMAIGATFPEHADYFSTTVNSVIAKELNVLGINNNYAPVVDVNTNANNPVINTRSFGESAQQVSQLGASAVNAIQAHGVMATLKHFPGHGDTHVDSHLGLPRVDHDRKTINNKDLAPFSWAIKYSNPAMIMTAHIQYPALDNSLFISKGGEKLIRPATMSRKILTDLLREDMSFKGIIATDALDMAGITHFFGEVEAVVETFIAGADLAVMPYKVRTPEDITGFYQFIREVAQSLSQRIEQGDYNMAEFEQAISRLNKYKSEYVKTNNDSLSIKTQIAKKQVATTKNLNEEQALANAAVTVLKAGSVTEERIIPITKAQIHRVHLVVASQQELDALMYAFTRNTNATRFESIVFSYFIADDETHNRVEESDYTSADLVLATIDIKTASLVDLGGMDDLKPSYGSVKQQQQKRTFSTALKQQLALANKYEIASILIAKGSPFLVDEYSELAGAVLLNYDDRIYMNREKQWESPGFNASVAVILGQMTATGKLPVTLH